MHQQVRGSCAPDISVKFKTKDHPTGLEVAYLHCGRGSADFTHRVAKTDAVESGHSVWRKLDACPFGFRSGFPLGYDDLRADSRESGRSGDSGGPCADDQSLIMDGGHSSTLFERNQEGFQVEAADLRFWESICSKDSLLSLVLFLCLQAKSGDRASNQSFQ